MDSKAKAATPAEQRSAHLTGVVTQIVARPGSTWAEIVIDGADNLYREIRAPYPLQNEDGSVTRLSAGDRVGIFVRPEI